LPGGVEGLAVARREERHLRRFGLTLVLVEGIEVALDDVTENMSHGAGGYVVAIRAREVPNLDVLVEAARSRPRCSFLLTFAHFSVEDALVELLRPLHVRRPLNHMDPLSWARRFHGGRTTSMGRPKRVNASGVWKEVMSTMRAFASTASTSISCACPLPAASIR
jgi:hypothetical protein